MVAVAGGVLMGKTTGEAFDFIEVMALNNYQWPNERTTKKVTSVYKTDGFSTLTAKVNFLSRKLDIISVNIVQSVQVCDLYGSPHHTVDCQVGNPFAPSSTKQANYVSNFPRQQNNPYSNT